VLRSLVSLCLVYAKAWELLVLQLSGSKAAVTGQTPPLDMGISEQHSSPQHIQAPQ
jgi:hypothetical protein